MKVLEYDEWVVPGEVEYAEKKDAEIESQIENYHKASLRGDWMCNDWDIHIQITEHIVGRYGVTIPKYVWDYAINDIDIYNSMKLDWYRDMVAPIDGPEMFDLPADDIRSSLPEWDDSFLPESVRRDIVAMHSRRYRVALEIESMDGHYGHIQERFHLSGPKCGRVMRSFLYKLKNEDKAAAYTELEEELGDFIEPYDSYVAFCYYKPWYFPLDMTGDGIADAVREAYLNASKRSRRISPKEMN
ncbi:hypothetical protein [Acetatifactor muris]|uniref:hypothetical protein n=1 Tax=Acetatifactor muris TaxID=879566 RepID=UPI000CD2733C|nr:hypothetical protein [Acetatifactor muris]MCX4306508.1 hypothetical protein [Acetatifactor sp.]